jgi:transcriptional regulator with XRE-family HTH domain
MTGGYNYTMENDFVTWLNTELQSRGWSNAELARRADIAPSAISMVLSGTREPSADFCIAVANALHRPVEEALYAAGLLPTYVDASARRVGYLVSQLPPHLRKYFVAMLEAAVEEAERETLEQHEPYSEEI